MFGGYRNVYFTRLMCFSIMFTRLPTEPVRRPPPTFEIIEKGNDLHFHGCPLKLINQSSHCWKYMFQYSKCKEKPVTINVTEAENWTAKVEYNSACKYTVQVQAVYNTKYCGEVQRDSDMSKPMYFGQDGDPNLLFKVAMIIIPVIVCTCLIIAILLFRRHKDKFFPQIPSPSHFYSDMFDSNQEMTKGLYVRELYVPNEEVVEEIHVEPKTV